MDAPHAHVAQLARSACGGVAHGLLVLELGDDAVRGHLSVRVGGGSDLQLGTHDEGVRELAGRAHAHRGDGATVRRHEVHQAEGQRLDARVRGDRVDLAQRAVRLDQHVDGQRLVGGTAAEICEDAVDLGAGLRHVGRVARLRNHQVRQSAARPTQQRLKLVGEGRVVDGVHTRPDAPVAVGLGHHHLGHKVRVLVLAAHRGAVFAVEGDVEDRPKSGLQFEALVHARGNPCVVIAHRQHRHAFIGVEQGFAGMARVHAQASSGCGVRGGGARRPALPSAH